MKRNQILALAFGALGVVLFSSKAIFVKLAYHFDIDSVSLLFLRMLIALPFYLVIFWLQTWKHKNKKLQRKDFVSLVILGCLGYYLASYLDFKGLQYISAGLERLILFVYPTMVVILSAIWLKTKITRVQILAIAVTYLGVAIIFLKPQALIGNVNIPLGSVLVFLSALSYSIYLIGSGEMIKRLGSVYFTSLVMMFSFLGVVIHFLFTKETDIWGFQTPVYTYAVSMAFIATVLPSYLIAESIKTLGASNFAIIGSIGPVSTIILAYLFLNEQLSTQQIIGGLVVIAGVTIVNLKKA